MTGETLVETLLALCHRAFVLAGGLVLLFAVTPALRAQESPHGELSHPCEECHSPSSWKDVSLLSKFDHTRTGFPLSGQHTLVQCQQCHKTLRFTATATACADCHKDVHRNELGSTCDRCHSPQSWLVPDMAQRHNATRFPLMGPHQTLPCQACHTNQQKQEYLSVSVDCVGCHRDTYDATTTPAHRSVGFGTDCEQCHSLTAFRWGGSFNHDMTGFPLTGAHAAGQCAQCHQNNKFTALATQCASCHLTDFAGASNPSHSGGGFSTDCVSCHSTVGWRPATLDHSKTGFPLTGAHAARQCSDCHKSGQFAGNPVQCYQCHQSSYATATTPVHTPGLPVDCTGCHNTTAWRPSVFNHSTTGFALTGAHTSGPCSGCHANGVYSSALTTCDGCHMADYNSTNNPVHSTAGFPASACATCHSTSAWTGATFNHTWFPQNHGNSGGVCTQCHANANDFSMFQCINCHPQSQVDPHHTGVRSYVYSNTACYNCHPTGRAG